MTTSLPPSPERRRARKEATMTESTTNNDVTTETTRSDADHWAKPVRTLTSKDVPAGAMDLNVTGHRVAGAGTGFGRLWQKSFSVRLEGASVTPREVKI